MSNERLRRVSRRLSALTGLVTAGVVGTAIVLPVATASADPSANTWYRLRMCESSNNYSINTGNGYYGAYQFDLPTWRSVGGSGYPNQASPAEQDARALMLYRMRGWEPWTCATILGLREDGDARSGRISDIHIGGSPSTSSASSSRASSPGVPAFPGTYYHYGDHSVNIKRFQDEMHARGYFPVGSGFYGPNTFTMVKQLQRLNGLIPNGEIGPNTWRLAWTGRYSPPSSSGSAPAMPGGDQWFSYGDHSSVIKQWQDRMHARGLFPVGTGDFGPHTLAVVKHIQGANGLPETGILGPVTWQLAWTGRY